MADFTRLAKVRPCGRLETFSTARHHLGFYRSVALTATYVLSNPSPARIEEEVFAALHHVIDRHPNLSAIALHEDCSYPNVYFARLPTIDLHKCVEFYTRKTAWPRDGERDQELDRILEQHHSRDFKQDLGSRPFWRLIVLKSPSESATIFTAIWMFHHALADGTSAFLFHETFLAGLNTAILPTDIGSCVTSSSTVLPPPLEELHPMSISWLFFLYAVVGAMLPGVFNKRPSKMWTGSPVPGETNPSPRYVHHTLVLSSQTTKDLVQICRKESTSLTAATQCLLAASLFANLPVTEYERVRIAGPISLRSFVDIEQGQMTSTISTYEYLHVRAPISSVDDIYQDQVMQYFSWDEARAVRAKIMTEVARKGCDNPIALLKYVPDMPKFLLDKLGKPRNLSAELSNVGAWKCEPAKGAKWVVGRMGFSQCPTLTGHPLAVNVITGGDGNAVFHFCWNESAANQSMIEEVIKSFGVGIETLIGARMDLKDV